MKIGAKVHYFNYEMRRRRKELGWTQARLAEESGVNLNALGCIERLLQPTANIRTANDYLLRIARTLEVEFGVLFPPEYLALVQQKLLPRRRSPYVWVKEVSLDQLAETAPELLMPGPEVTVIDAEMQDQVLELVAMLPVREAAVLEMRYGLNGAARGTMEEVAAVFGITRERVRQIEGRALRRLRHPVRSRKLDVYVNRQPGRWAERDKEREQQHDHSEQAMQGRVEMAARKESRARAIRRARAYKGGIRFRVPKRSEVEVRA